ncbi:MAG TPA: hypothetical protein VMR86_09190 [Myxococcota bacterium]|nr:hypothetical protein [Myxococcota bacterium]
MTRALLAGLAAALLICAACGHYGPPVRTSDTAEKKPGATPSDPNAPAAPKAPAPAPEPETEGPR